MGLSFGKVPYGALPPIDVWHGHASTFKRRRAFEEKVEEMPNVIQTSHAESISHLLSQYASSQFTPKTHEVGQVLVLRSTDFSSLQAMREAYQGLRKPALCLVHDDELPEVLAWLRDTDDVGRLDDPDDLNHWRRERIMQGCAGQIDPQTGLFQRSRLVESLEGLCTRATASQPVSLILLDIDHLKSINDQFGPAGGNRILKDLGELVISLCPDSFVARTRGGEFGVLVEAPEQVASEVARVLINAIDSEQWSIAFSVSFGVASVDESCGASSLLTRADEALFSAKANGRGRVVAYSEIAAESHLTGEDVRVISLENKARVMSERVTSFVTQQSKMIMQNLHREANTDSLTGLFNRRYLDRKLTDEVSLAKKTDRDLSVALLDVDHFGEVNKAFGWPTGDRVLRDVSQTIGTCIRATDWVGRYGGEEICIVMPTTPLDNAVIVCERIRQAIESQEFEATDQSRLSITLSVGVVHLDPTESVDVMLERVSKKTLEAKQNGRNQVVS